MEMVFLGAFHFEILRKLSVEEIDDDEFKQVGFKNI